MSEEKKVVIADIVSNSEEQSNIDLLKSLGKKLRKPKPKADPFISYLDLLARCHPSFKKVVSGIKLELQSVDSSSENYLVLQAAAFANNLADYFDFDSDTESISSSSSYSNSSSDPKPSPSRPPRRN